LLLLAGGTTPLTIAFRSAPANFLFDGTASLADNAYFDGRASFSTPSMRRMLEWSRADVLHGSAIGAIGIESRVMGTTERVRFEDAEITLDGNPGSGALDLLLTGKSPAVSGTLAFDNIDLGAFLSAFTPLEPSGGTGLGVIDANFANLINLDLRLSAARATAGSIALADVAATARVNDGLAAFDISDAKAFGGAIQTGLRFDRKAQGTHVEMRLLASEIDGGAFGSAAGMTRFVPSGRGTASIILNGQGTSWDALLEHASGSISASFGSGALSGIDMEGFLTRAREGGFFALEEVSDGAFPIDALDFKASVSDGVATIERAEARSSLHRVVLSGKVPYTGRGLALSGKIEPGQQAAREAGEATGPSFFVGGSWNAPFISPAEAGPPPE
jgi:AsmA protein